MAGKDTIELKVKDLNWLEKDDEKAEPLRFCLFRKLRYVILQCSFDKSFEQRMRSVGS